MEFDWIGFSPIFTDHIFFSSPQLSLCLQTTRKKNLVQRLQNAFTDGGTLLGTKGLQVEPFKNWSLGLSKINTKNNYKLGSENKLKAGKLKELSYMIHHTAVESRLFLKQNGKIKQYDCNFNTRFQLITFLLFGLCSG